MKKTIQLNGIDVLGLVDWNSYLIDSRMINGLSPDPFQVSHSLSYQTTKKTAHNSESNVYDFFVWQKHLQIQLH